MNRKACFIVAAIVLTVFLFTAAACADLTLSDTDYANPENWLQFAQNSDQPVDIFAIYPTVTFSIEGADLPFVRLDSPLMRQGAEEWLGRSDFLLAQGNVYMPLYRQLNAAMLADLDAEGFMSYTVSTPRDDVFAAFAYFLTNINKGERPFILYGHSQGGQLVNEIAGLLLGDAEYSAYNAYHVATYAIGSSVTEAGIALNPALKFATGPLDTGVIVSWNTIAPSEIGTGAYKQFGTWKEGALTINPITWTTEELLAHAGDNAVSYVLSAENALEKDEYCVNALVDNEHGVLVVTSQDEARYPVMTPTVSKYHRFDEMFFYGAIAQNIQDRVEAYLAANP